VIGVLLAYGAVYWIASAMPYYSFPHEAAIHVSLPVLVFSVLVAILTGILFGMYPAVQLSRPNLTELIQSGSGRHSGGGGARKTHRLLLPDRSRLRSYCCRSLVPQHVHF
jgi:hypothetical protein